MIFAVENISPKKISATANLWPRSDASFFERESGMLLLLPEAVSRCSKDRLGKPVLSRIRTA